MKNPYKVHGSHSVPASVVNRMARKKVTLTTLAEALAAVGYASVHLEQQQQLVRAALIESQALNWKTDISMKLMHPFFPSLSRMAALLLIICRVTLSPATRCWLILKPIKW